MLRIGLVQMRCEKGDIAANLGAIAAYLRTGRERGIDMERGIDIMCFPEGSITGYVDPRRYPEAVLSLSDPAIAQFAALTRTGPVTALAGIIERNPDGLPYITQIVARDGEVLGFLRKRTIPEEAADLFAPATTAGVFAHPEIPFGIAICADIDNAALFAEHARGGARVIFEVAAPGLYGDQATRDWAAGYDWWEGKCATKLGRYAREYGVYIAIATQAGRTRDEDFPGGGYVFGPDGQRLSATADWSEGVLYATIGD